MDYHKALPIAMAIKSQLEPHCERIMLVGSLRRRRPTVKDIEFVLIPKPYQTGLFASGIAPVINQWPKIKGELPCKYTQRQLPEGIKLDLFMADPLNFGYIVALRTGPVEYNKCKLLPRIKQRRLLALDGYIQNESSGKTIALPQERDFFNALGIRYCPPHLRGDPRSSPPTDFVLNISNAPAS